MNKLNLPLKYINSFFNFGKLLFTIGLAELTILIFFKGDFAMTRPPKTPEILLTLNPFLAYVCATILLVCISLIVARKLEVPAVVTICIIIFTCVTSRHLFNLWKDPVNAFKSVWFISGSFLLLAELKSFNHHKKTIVYYNCIILFIFFYHCAIGHIQYGQDVQLLIPEYIPYKLFFTYFAGICLLLGGIGLLIPRFQKLAALLSGIQIFGWFILLHIPRAINLKGDTWIGVGESLAASGLCFMLYDLFDASDKLNYI